MKKINKKLVLPIIILVVISFVIAIFSIIHHKEFDVKETSSGNAIAALSKEDKKEAVYITDTNYTGADVPMELYNQSFNVMDYEPERFTEKKKQQMDETDEAYFYTPNKKLAKYYTEEELTEYTEKSRNVFETIVTPSYKEILKNQDKYVNDIVSLFGEDGVYYYKEDADDLTYVSDFASDLEQYLIDNKCEATMEFDTDKSLVFIKEGFVTVRGLLKVSFNSTKEISAPFLGATPIDNKIAIICETSFNQSMGNNLVGIDVLKYSNEL